MISDILDRDEDRPAYVRFERRAVKDNEASMKAGHYMSMDEDWALVTPPYSKDCVQKKAEVWFRQAEEKVRDGRIPERHLRLWKETYERWKQGQEPPVDGTSVRDWNALSPAQCENLIRAGCRTIEDVAQANDEALRRIGMGAVSLKNQAKAWLQAAKDHGPLTMELEEMRKENEVLKASIERMETQIALLVQERDKQIANAADPRLVELRQAYEVKFGKKPGGRYTIEGLERVLENAS